MRIAIAALAALTVLAPSASAQDTTPRQFVLVGTLADGTRILCPGKTDDHAATAILPLDSGGACFLDRSQVKIETPVPTPSCPIVEKPRKLR